MSEASAPRRRSTRLQAATSNEPSIALGQRNEPTTPKANKRRKLANTALPLSPFVGHFTPSKLRTDEAKFGLIQERMAPDIWKMLIATCLLNQTSGRAAVPVLYQILERWPTAHALAAADLQELTQVIYPIGLYNRRARMLIRFSQTYVDEPPTEGILSCNKSDRAYVPTMISHYPGVGRYALDSYRIFIENANSSEPSWRSVLPLDKELKKYLEWRWALEGKAWDPQKGVTGDLSVAQQEVFHVAQLERASRYWSKE
ncbi:uncharacterized protein L969DRAFT_23520 [Mixia osmundae IAM 14324]|uniref:HhH-GPD domain-containing protein n=1 Tax=Mixia osmundae (strain CBS 9802 / IAM 14324 / JCM 22182 / KY 12970) TaxID=764103 RepID=G7E2R8_MIXOS|nr:uncharacterized protein L969DRAFT_23520 [Mixia osmundae IAM 14324]KEI40321.1 hypothetical protein L969DRAFT_23520 [Mixia osmundae IAM 14324]GAA97128.1 hypothetical protein E5Q_03803 [Mixia osmundae IAM 14324]